MGALFDKVNLMSCGNKANLLIISKSGDYFMYYNAYYAFQKVVYTYNKLLYKFRIYTDV